MFGHRWIRREFEDWQPTQHQRLQRGRRQQQQWSASFCACLSKRRIGIRKQKTESRLGGAGQGEGQAPGARVPSLPDTFRIVSNGTPMPSLPNKTRPEIAAFFSRPCHPLHLCFSVTHFKFMTRSWQHTAKGREGRTGGGRSGPAQLVHPSSRSQSDVGEGMERESGLQLTNP